MTAFLDSSALVKLYVAEEGHLQVRRLAPPYIVTELARAEVPAALWRKHRIGELDAQDAAILVRAFEADILDPSSTRFSRMGVTSDIIAAAARLVARHPLRAYDAVQLASAMTARHALATPFPFGAFDRSLRTAAAIEDFTLAPDST